MTYLGNVARQPSGHSLGFSGQFDTWASFSFCVNWSPQNVHTKGLWAQSLSWSIVDIRGPLCVHSAAYLQEIISCRQLLLWRSFSWLFIPLQLHPSLMHLMFIRDTNPFNVTLTVKACRSDGRMGSLQMGHFLCSGVFSHTCEMQLKQHECPHLSVAGRCIASWLKCNNKCNNKCYEHIVGCIEELLSEYWII